VTANITFWQAIDLDALSHVAPLVYLFPALVPPFAWALGQERPTWATWVAAAVAVSGCALVLGAGLSGPHSAVAAVLALIAAVANAAFYLAAAEVLRRDGDPMVVAAVVFVAAGIAVAVLAAATGLRFPHGAGLLLVLVAGTLCTALPYWLWLTAIRWIGETRAALLAVAEPAFAVLLAIVLLGEHLAARQALGIGLILVSFVVPSLRRAD
jgi:DME family drug/metabolite transporter